MMKLIQWMIPASLILLGSGCAQIKSDSYCDVAYPMYFEDDHTIDVLEEHDRELMIDVLVHNETYEKLCD